MKLINLFFMMLITNTVFAVQPPQTVEYVDVLKYQGQWYEIAKITNSFQKKCTQGTTADYKILSAEELQVTNSCIKSTGEVDVAEGRARIEDNVSNAQLKVTFAKIFGKWIYAFGGDYWIIGLEPNYEWAIVGHPTREYGWILSRKSFLSAEQLSEIKKKLSEQGYDVCLFETTPQENGFDKVQRLCD